MKYADLHIHTNKSDSTFSPQEVVKYAAKSGLSAISITDHDSVEAIPQVIDIADKYNIEVIPGVELSADVDGEEVHVLGYCIDYTKKWFLEKLELLRQYRFLRAQKIIEKLNGIGVKISLEEVLRVSGEGAVGRLHIAKTLQQKRYIHSIPEAFARYIGRNKPAYIRKYRITPKEAINIIKELGGVSVFAHPQLIGQDIWIPQMVKDGLDGIEVYHSDHNKQSQEHYLELAEKYNLLVTGGSDCHGIGKGKVLIGRVKIPYELVEKLKSRVKLRK